MAKRACLDASVAVKLFVSEEGEDRAWALLERLRDAEAEIVVPAFFAAEVLSTLRRKVVQGKMTEADGEEVVREFLALLSDVNQLSKPELYQQAWSMAFLLGQPTLYDAVYLAVAKDQGAEFWTADETLHERARALSLEWVKLL